MLVAHPTYGNKCSTSEDISDSPLGLILNLQGHQQNRSLGIDPIWSVELYYPHDNIFESHSCDEYRTSNALNVCHELVSIGDCASKLVY